METNLSLKIDSDDFEQEVENHEHVEKEEVHETTTGEIEDDDASLSLQDNTKIKEVFCFSLNEIRSNYICIIFLNLLKIRFFFFYVTLIAYLNE